MRFNRRQPWIEEDEFESRKRAKAYAKRIEDWKVQTKVIKTSRGYKVVARNTYFDPRYKI